MQKTLPDNYHLHSEYSYIQDTCAWSFVGITLAFGAGSMCFIVSYSLSTLVTFPRSVLVAQLPSGGFLASLLIAICYLLIPPVWGLIVPVMVRAAVLKMLGGKPQFCGLVGVPFVLHAFDRSLYFKRTEYLLFEVFTLFLLALLVSILGLLIDTFSLIPIALGIGLHMSIWGTHRLPALFWVSRLSHVVLFRESLCNTITAYVPFERQQGDQDIMGLRPFK